MTFTCVSFAVCLSQLLSATDQEPPDVAKQWLNSAWAQSRQFPKCTPGIAVEWVFENLLSPSAVEMAAMRKGVEGHPVHPQRLMLETYERRLAGQADVSKCHFVCPTSRQWRFSEILTLPNEAPPIFRATVVDQATMWSFCEGQVLVVSTESHPPEHDFAALVDPAGVAMTLVLDGGFGLRPDLQANPGPLVFDNADNWHMTARSERGATIRYSGVWDVESRSGLVTRILLEFDGGAFESGEYTLVGHQFDYNLKKWIPDRVDHRIGARLQGRYREIAVSAIAPNSIESLLRHPTLDRRDSLWSDQVVRSVVDFRAGSRVEDFVNVDGSRARREASPREKGSVTGTDIAGWSLASVVVLSVAVVAWRRLR